MHPAIGLIGIKNTSNGFAEELVIIDMEVILLFNALTCKVDLQYLVDDNSRVNQHSLLSHEPSISTSKATKLTLAKPHSPQIVYHIQ
jgi:hypothetical protein